MSTNFIQSGNGMSDGFIPPWWAELGTVTPSRIRAARALGDSEGFAAPLSAMRDTGQVSAAFGEPITRLNQQLVHLPGVPFYADFRFTHSDPYSTYTYTRGRFCAWQYHLGWSGAPTEEPLLRIGLGFRWFPSAHNHSDASASGRTLQGLRDYALLKQIVQANPRQFDQTFTDPNIFGPLAKHLYLEGLPLGGSLAQTVLSDQPTENDWRFLGYGLHWTDPQDRQVMEQLALLVPLIRQVFQHLTDNGYQPQTL
jgi:hypothetical protein